MEQNMGEVSNMLGNLRNMAVDMGNEIGSQNRALDRINQKVMYVTRLLLSDENQRWWIELGCLVALMAQMITSKGQLKNFSITNQELVLTSIACCCLQHALCNRSDNWSHFMRWRHFFAIGKLACQLSYLGRMTDRTHIGC